MPHPRGLLTVELFEERTLPSNFAFPFHDRPERPERPEPRGLGALVVSFRPLADLFRHNDDSPPSFEKRDPSPVTISKSTPSKEIEPVSKPAIEKSGIVNVVVAPTPEPAATPPATIARAALNVIRSIVAAAEREFFAPPASEHAATPVPPTNPANASVERPATAPDVQVASNLATLALYALSESGADAPTLSPNIVQSIPESVPQPETAPAPYEILPIVVDLPQSPIIGALTLEVAAIGDGITRVLDRAAEIVAEELDGENGHAWYAAGTLLGAWVGYALWSSRTTRKPALEVRHDARTG